MTTSAAPGWYPDPAGHFDHRYFDGQRWSAHVSRGGQATTDPAFDAPGQIPSHSATPRPEVAAASACAGPSAPHSDDAILQEERTHGDSADHLIDLGLEKLNTGRTGLLAGRKRSEELAELRRSLDRIGATEREALRRDIEGLQAERDQARSHYAAELDKLERELQTRRTDHATMLMNLEAQLDELRSQIVETEERSILQEVGIYEYRHPLDDAVAYKARLAQGPDRSSS
jgi:hypothetical protein